MHQCGTQIQCSDVHTDVVVTYHVKHCRLNWCGVEVGITRMMMAMTTQWDDDVHLQSPRKLRRIPVKIKMIARVKISVWKLILNKYHWNMMHLYQIGRLKLWIYTYIQQMRRHRSEYKSRF